MRQIKQKSKNSNRIQLNQIDISNINQIEMRQSKQKSNRIKKEAENEYTTSNSNQI